MQPIHKRFAVQRIVGNGNLWVTEFVLSYDGVPSYAVSIMEFSDGKVARETQYFGDRFSPGPLKRTWSSRITERIPLRAIRSTAWVRFWHSATFRCDASSRYWT